MEAVGVSERLQGRNWGQDVTQTDSLPQQPQSDQGTCPPQHLHGTLLTAALQAHPVHLREGTRDVKVGSREKSQDESTGVMETEAFFFVDGVDSMEAQQVQVNLMGK